MATNVAVGIARQSHGDGESIAQQTIRIVDACKRDGLDLLIVHPEQDVSGGTPLHRRKGLLAAVEAVEAGEANVIVAAYFDRLFRSLKVQAELLERVERAGGKVLALDTGEVTNGSAGSWLSGTMLGMVSEYHRRTTGERVRVAHGASVAAGVPPYPFSTPGYVQRDDGTVAVADTAPAVTEAFRLRATGATIGAVREHLQGAGIDISYRATQTLLKSRAVLGELRFGEHENLRAWDPIVTRDVWEAVQRARVRQGRKSKSDRLLARLEVLFCSGCQRPMVVGSSVADGRRYPNYRCSLADGDCPDRQVISARIAEAVAREHAERIAADGRGHASAAAEYGAAVAQRDAAQDRLDAMMGRLARLGLKDEPAAMEETTRLKAERDRWKVSVDELAPLGATATATLADWDAPDVTLEDRRVFVRSTIARMVVHSGRGAGRVKVQALGQASPRYAV